MSEFKATCRGPNCKQIILMRQLNPVRPPHPFNVKPEKCKRCKGKGRVEQPPQLSLMGEQGPTVSDCPKCKGTGKRWVSHFDTCVDADRFRTKADA